MDFATAIKTVFAKYATFDGRASRTEYWFFCLFSFVGALVTMAADIARFTDSDSKATLNTIFLLATLVPGVSCGVRRLHDIDKSGWWQLLWCVPVIGWTVIIAWACTGGTSGDNRFGPPPRETTQRAAATQPIARAGIS